MTSHRSDTPRFLQHVAGLTVLLALLFSVLQPPATAHLGFLTAFVAWLAHIGLGMLCALTATRVLLDAAPLLAGRPWPALVLGGIGGSLLFTPIALGLEALLPAAPTAQADDWIDAWESQGGTRAAVAEWLSLTPSYLSAWLLINAMPMMRVGKVLLVTHPDQVRDEAGPTDHTDSLADSTVTGATAQGVGEDPASAPTPQQSPSCPPEPAAQRLAAEGLLERLPAAVGLNLVSISSDLHYLQVVTRRGRATILGSLSEAEAELGTRGIRIHRSHWVARDSIRRLKRNVHGWRCELDDGRSLPVSRRRAAEIKRQIGTDFVVEVSA